MRVFHQKFGYGAVIGTEGDKLEIAFDKAGVKKVVAKFVFGAAMTRYDDDSVLTPTRFTAALVADGGAMLMGGRDDYDRDTVYGDIKSMVVMETTL